MESSVGDSPLFPAVNDRRFHRPVVPASWLTSVATGFPGSISGEIRAKRSRSDPWAIEGLDAKPTFGQRRIARRKKKPAPCAPAPRILDPTRPRARDVTGIPPVPAERAAA